MRSSRGSDDAAMAPGDPELIPASRRRRFAAGAVLPAAVMSATFAAMAVIAVRGYDNEDLRQRVLDAFTRFQDSPQGQVIFARQPIYAYAAAVRRRNRPWPGQGLFGLRTVDARTGGPVTVRSAVIGYAANEGIRVVGAWIFTFPTSSDAERPEAQQQALKSCLGHIALSLAPRLNARRNLLDRLSGTVVVRV